MMTTQTTITVEQVSAGDLVSLNGRDARFAFTVKSIRDGMQSGIGLRTTDGEYVKLPFGHTLTRFTEQVEHAAAGRAACTCGASWKREGAAYLAAHLDHFAAKES